MVLAPECSILIGPFIWFIQTNGALNSYVALSGGRLSGYSAAARRSDSDSRSAAASTAGACMRPG